MGERVDVTFTSGGDICAAWWYRASAGTAAPCVVMGHGFSLTREDGLPPIAERFARAGFHALVFDFRHLGDSGGTPRQRFRAGAQREDWRNAVAFARTLEGVSGVVMWGYSFGAGHAAALLTQRAVDVQAALLLCPFVDGLARVLATPPALAAWILSRAAADLAGRHNLIPVTGPPGSRAAMTFAGESAGFSSAVSGDSRWRNEISPGIFATVALHRPAARAARIGVPLWVGRCHDDVTVSGDAVGRLASRAPSGELHEFPGDHFAPFVRDEVRDAVVASQLDFLARVT